MAADHDRKYHDGKYNQEHEWNTNEDHAYRVWVKEHHRKYRDFSKIKEEERQSYWEWRHDHPDAELKVKVHR
jgi:hypothetical protein